MGLSLTTGSAVEQDVDEAINEFNGYFRRVQEDSLGEGLSLSGPEVAIIKTFCAYFLGLGPDNPRAVTPPTKRSPDAPANHS